MAYSRPIQALIAASQNLTVPVKTAMQALRNLDHHVQQQEIEDFTQAAFQEHFQQLAADQVARLWQGDGCTPGDILWFRGLIVEDLLQPLSGSAVFLPNTPARLPMAYNVPAHAWIRWSAERADDVTLRDHTLHFVIRVISLQALHHDFQSSNALAPWAQFLEAAEPYWGQEPGILRRASSLFLQGVRAVTARKSAAAATSSITLVNMGSDTTYPDLAIVKDTAGDRLSLCAWLERAPAALPVDLYVQLTFAHIRNAEAVAFILHALCLIQQRFTYFQRLLSVLSQQQDPISVRAREQVLTAWKAQCVSMDQDSGLKICEQDARKALPEALQKELGGYHPSNVAVREQDVQSPEAGCFDTIFSCWPRSRP